MLSKRSVLEISENLKKTLVLESFFNKVAALKGILQTCAQAASAGYIF